MGNKKYCFFLLIPLFIALALPQISGAKNKILMVTSADNPPFEFHRTEDGKDEIVGLDIDLAKEIAKKLGVELQIKDIDFPGILPMIKTKRADFAMAAMQKTPARIKHADFSTPYFKAMVALVSRKNRPITHKGQLKQLTVAAQLGTFYEGLAKEWQKSVPGLKIKTLNNIGHMMQELELGRVQAVLVEGSTGSSFVKKHPHLTSQELPIGAEYHVLFPKNSPLKEKFDKVLLELRQSGTITQISNKWNSKASKK